MGNILKVCRGKTKGNKLRKLQMFYFDQYPCEGSHQTFCIRIIEIKKIFMLERSTAVRLKLGMTYILFDFIQQVKKETLAIDLVVLLFLTL